MFLATLVRFSLDVYHCRAAAANVAEGRFPAPAMYAILFFSLPSMLMITASPWYFHVHGPTTLRPLFQIVMASRQVLRSHPVAQFYPRITRVQLFPSVLLLENKPVLFPGLRALNNEASSTSTFPGRNIKLMTRSLLVFDTPRGRRCVFSFLSHCSLVNQKIKKSLEASSIHPRPADA